MFIEENELLPEEQKRLKICRGTFCILTEWSIAKLNKTEA